MTHFVYLIRARKVGATRRLRDRLREQGHDLPHRVTDDGQVLLGDPDVEVLAVYTGQSDERIGDAEWAFARAHRLSRETFGDRAMMSERGRRGAAVSNARRVRCPPAGDGPATRRARRGGTDRGSAGDGSALGGGGAAARSRRMLDGAAREALPLAAANALRRKRCEKSMARNGRPNPSRASRGYRRRRDTASLSS